MKRTRAIPKRPRVAVISEFMDFEASIGRRSQFVETVTALNSEAYENGIELFYFDMKLDLASFVRKKEHRSYDGIIGTAKWWPRKSEKIWDAIERDVPCVYMFTPPRREHAYFAGVDEHMAMGLLVDHLVAEGHTTIGFAAASAQYYTLMRYIGYRDAMKRHGLTVHPEQVHGFDAHTAHFPVTLTKRLDRGEWHEKVFPRSAVYPFFMRRNTPPSAIIFENDSLALHFYSTAAANGIRIPYHVAVAGFGNERFRFARYTNFLTTIDQQYGAIGAAAIRMLSRVMAGEAPEQQHIFIEPRLIVRKSTLKRSLKRTEQSDEALKGAIGKYIIEHYSDPELMKEIAVSFNMSRDYFRQRFAKLFGMTFTAYLNDTRLKRAAEALTKTTRSVTRIIIESGFNNYQNFSYSFKKKFGVAPREFRTVSERNSLQPHA
ncbi:MAG: substrate-binding domain-containing protein [Spirochaetes bacterium]|nr:substrate-binding domain-containing protein [Spirochaetota bacterium]